MNLRINTLGLKDQLITITKKLLKSNKISFDAKELAFQIKSHPSYPSLHSITGVLDHFGIENIAAEVPTTLDVLNQLPSSFIAQLSTDKGDDLYYVNKKSDNYSIYSDELSYISKKDFLLDFTGVILAVEKTEHKHVKRKNNGLNFLFLGIGLILTSAYLFNSFINYWQLIYFLLSALGSLISYSIIRQELGDSTIIGDAFCSGTSEKKDCDAVLSSKGANLFFGLKLSDLSIVYFLSNLLLSVFNYNNAILISFLSIPVIFYSLIYQYKVIKSWCLLCLSIAGVLVLQTLVSYLSLISADYTLQSFIASSLVFVLNFIIWYNARPLIDEYVSLQSDKLESQKFKRNFDLFETMLQKSQTYDTVITNSNEIVLGNKNALLEIVVVTNPFCGHCKQVHKTVEKILEVYSDIVKVIIRFNVDTSKDNSKGLKVASVLNDIYFNRNEVICLEAMSEIYEGANYEDWLIKWESDDSLNPNTVKSQKEWCVRNAINFTPELLVNGKSYPKEYKRNDLLFFIEDLHESCSKKYGIQQNIT